MKESDRELIVRAAAYLRDGELVAFPTETVYGLGADASNPDALRQLYAAKGRPSDHPVIVHLADYEQVHQWAQDVPRFLENLAKQFWPGPLTVVLRRAPHVLDLVTGGQDTVALRIPSHPIALSLLREFGRGLAAPSANRFGRLSPTRADDVRRDLGDLVSMVLDGGPCEVGIESTIVDLSSGGSATILRPGMILGAEIERIAGMPVQFKEFPGPPKSDSIRVPGALPSHYAPLTPMMLLPSSRLIAGIHELLSRPSQRLAVLAFQPNSFNQPGVAWNQAPLAAGDYARQLYFYLRRLDALEADWIIVEEPPVEAAWSGIADRLHRAATKNRATL